MKKITPEKLERAEILTKKFTAFKNFNDLLTAKDGYFPSLTKRSMKELADLYDEAQAERKDPRRAFRW